MRRAICPGSFDPITAGHLDVLERAAQLYDEVVCAILHNPAKSGAFAIEERLTQIAEATEHLPNVRAEAFANQLMVDVAAQVGAGAVIKGLRDGTDFAYELPMARMNRQLTGIETVFLPGDPTVSHISSSLVKEVARFGGDVTGMVPPAVAQALHAKAEHTRP